MNHLQRLFLLRIILDVSKEGAILNGRKTREGKGKVVALPLGVLRSHGFLQSIVGIPDPLLPRLKVNGHRKQMVVH